MKVTARCVLYLGYILLGVTISQLVDGTGTVWSVLLALVLIVLSISLIVRLQDPKTGSSKEAIK